MVRIHTPPMRPRRQQPRPPAEFDRARLSRREPLDEPRDEPLDEPFDPPNDHTA